MGKIKRRKKPCSKGDDCCGFSPCQHKELKARAKAENKPYKKVVIELDKLISGDDEPKKKKKKKEKKADKKASKEAKKDEKKKRKKQGSK